MKVYCKILHQLVVLETNNGMQFRVRITSLGYRSLHRYGLDAARALARTHICAQMRRHPAPLFCIRLYFQSSIFYPLSSDLWLALS